MKSMMASGYYLVCYPKDTFTAKDMKTFNQHHQLQSFIPLIRDCQCCSYYRVYWYAFVDGSCLTYISFFSSSVASTTSWINHTIYHFLSRYWSNHVWNHYSGSHQKISTTSSWSIRTASGICHGENDWSLSDTNIRDYVAATQVDRVIPKYLDFLTLFPTVDALAHADKQQLLAAWSGLGYNSRVLNLQKQHKQ